MKSPMPVRQSANPLLMKNSATATMIKLMDMVRSLAVWTFLKL